MKMTKLLLLLFFMFSLTKNALAQNDNPCNLLLQNGLYETYDINKSGNFSSDFKQYLISNTFKNDFKSGKWKGSLFTIIKGSPVKLDADANDEQINAFQQSISSGTEFSLNQSFYESVKISTVNTRLAEIYEQCIRDLPPIVGFRVSATVNEKDVFFIVTYKKMSSTDPMPTVTLFQLKNGTNVVRSFRDGGLLQDSNTISADRDSNKDLSLIIETDKGVVTYKVPAEPSGFNKDFPLGTIITSYLDFQQFSAVTLNNLNSPSNIWTSKFSKWAPADGRPIPNSQLALLTSQSNLPDLRGLFLRGLNQFDPNSPVPQNNARNDTEKDRKVGSFQADEFKKHTHHFAGSLNQTRSGPDSSSWGENANDDKRTDLNVIPPGGEETRPKNVAVYYYIRIN